MAIFSASNGPEKRGALAVFCRAPRLGAVKTRLAQTHGASFALQLYRAMLADTLALVRASAPQIETFVVFTPHDAFEGAESLADLWSGPRFSQCEGDLGAKILHCFAHLRLRGFQKIVVIGSDSPDLPLPLLRQAFEALDEHALVFGPASDGGFYLMGSSCAVPTQLFENVKWSQSDTLESIEANHQRCFPQENLTRLDLWHDVDNEDNLRELQQRLLQSGSHAPRTREFLAKSL